MDKHTSCLICGSAALRPLAGAYTSTGLVRCANCRFVFMERIPTAAELGAYYSVYAYSGEGFLSPITMKRYNELLDGMEPYRKHGRLLDVGCGRGWFLIEARKRGWDVYGTEYSQAAIDLGRSNSIVMHQGGLNDEAFPGMEFDIITSFEVLEHTNAPLEDLRHINRMLRKGGLHYCTTPNFNSLLRYYLKGRYNVINYPEHLSYYTRPTLNKLMRGAGLQPLRVETTGISLSRLKTSMGDKKEKLVDAGSSDERLRNDIESKWYLMLAKRTVDRLLSITGTGMSLKGHFRKP